MSFAGVACSALMSWPPQVLKHGLVFGGFWPHPLMLFGHVFVFVYRTAFLET